MVPASDPEPAVVLRRYELLANCSRDIILYIRRSDGRILDANRIAVEAYGYPRPELLELTVYDLRPPETRAAASQQMAAAERHGVLFQTIHRRKDGTTFPVEVSSQGGAEGDELVLVSVIRDISLRHDTQVALQASEERLRLAIEAAGIGIYDFDVPGDRIRLSPELCDMAGLPRGATLTQREAFRFVHRSDLHLVGAAQDLALNPRGDGFVCVEFRMMRVDGGERVVRWTGRTTFIDTPEGRRACRQLGCVMDITERSRVEGEARRWEHAFEHAGIAISMTHTAPHLIRAVNPAFAELHGYVREELVGRPVISLIAPEERTHVRALLQPMEDRVGHMAFETIHQRKDGTTFPVLVDLTVEPDDSGRPGRRIAFVQDLTEQKRAQEHLRRSEALYRAIARNIPDAVVAVVDTNLYYLAVEGSAAVRFGMIREQMEGRTVGEAGIDDASRESTLEMYKRALRGESIHMDTKHRGRQVWMHFVPLSDDAGRIVGAMALLQDITERKHVEEQLRHVQKLESIGLLAGGIAHDFNNLLVGVIGNASIIHQGLPPNSPLRRIASNVLEAGEQAADLTRQLLAYAGKGRFVLAPVDLSAVVEQTRALIERSISKKISLDLNLQSGLPRVQTDRSQMQQVFMNLAINAAEAIGKTAGVIRVATGVAQLDPDCIRRDLSGWPIEPGPCVFLEVTDTGGGMDPETQGRIFDPFFSTKFQGRGLGLAAVAGIVRAHKGAIHVTTAPGSGSTFRVLLPPMHRPA